MNTQGVHMKILRYIYPLLFALIDYVAVIIAEKISVEIYNRLNPSFLITDTVAPQYVYFWIPLVFIAFLGQSRSYVQMTPILDTVKGVFQAILLGLVSDTIILSFFQVDVLISPSLIFIFFLVVTFNIYFIRYFIHKILKNGHFFYEPVILIGAGKTAERVLRFFDGDLGYRFDVIGIIDDAPVSSFVVDKFLLYGNIDQAESIIHDSGVKTVIITAPGMERKKLQALISKIQPYVRNISYVPDLIGTPMAGVEAEVLFSEEILMLNVKNNLARRRNRVIKRVFDVIVSVIGGMIISPILLVLAVMVAIDNRGRVIFAHKRVGRNGELFSCYKFQTMVPDAQERLKDYLDKNPQARAEWEETFKLTNDPRVTKLGAFLRRTSLDELPQLWNVIRGDMSLVGPRPIVMEEIDRYEDSFREYSMVLPGITGMWQVSGRSDTTYEERVEMDTWYVRNWSIWIDLMYLVKTFKAVIAGKGAY